MVKLNFLKKKKQEVLQIFNQRLEKLIPGIKDIIVYSEVATPKTIVRYTKNPAGSVYGFAQIPNQAGRNRIHPTDIPISNLYFASAWTRPSGGFSGAIISGYTCALRVLRQHFPEINQ